MHKVRVAAIAALLAAAALLAGIHGGPAIAQTVDTWSGHNELVVPFSAAVTLAASPSIVCTAVSATRFNVRSITLTNSASGVVELYDGAGGGGSSVIGAFGLIANTPLTVTEGMLGPGLKTTAGNGLYINGATGTITCTVRVRKDPN